MGSNNIIGKKKDKLPPGDEMYKIQFNLFPEPLTVWNREGILLMQNIKSAENMLGDRENFIGRNIIDIFGEPGKGYLERIRRVLDNGKMETQEDEVELPGGIRHFWTCMQPIIYGDRQDAVQIVSYDISERKRIEEALGESEKKYRLLFDGMIEGFALHEIILDNKGNPCDYRFLSLNPAFEKLTGLKADDIIGKKVSEVLPTIDNFWIDKYGKVALSGISLDFEKYFPELNKYFKVSAFSHKKGYFAVVFEDITRLYNSEKELQGVKTHLENLINYANAPIIVWNPDTEIQLFNKAFERLTGYCSYEVKGKKLELLFPKATLEESNEKIRHSLTKNWETIEIPILTKRKEIKTVIWNSANIYETGSNKVVSTIAQGNDITKILKAEQKIKDRTKELEELNYKLEKELKERKLAQAALRKKEVQLKELNSTKDKFFNIVAHDLKNPFTSLLGSSELLSENIHQMDKKSIKELALILSDSAKSGYAILQNLLDWSRSQTGLIRFDPEKIILRNLIDENISNVQLQANNKEISLHCEVEDNIYIFSDKNMINTVLRNLLSNALKFTYRHGMVVITTTNGSDKIIISVKDTGVGIASDKIEKLFKIATNNVMHGTDNEQGTGLGLKLCKEFVEKQGGKIWVRSNLNNGSEFLFTVPLFKG